MEHNYIFEQLFTEDGRKKLACTILPRLTIGVNVFHGNNQTYVHIGSKGKSVSLLYEDFEELTNMRKSLELQLPWLNELMGGDEVYLYHGKLIRKDAFDGGCNLWHQDYGYWYKNGLLFPDGLMTVFIAIDRCQKENGCLQILRGSHRCGRIEHSQVAGQTMADLERVDVIKEKCPLEHVELEPGDALFFHANLLHTSAPNTSSIRRWALLYCYNKKSNNPIYKHHHPFYTPLIKVPDLSIKECRNYTDLSGKDFMDPDTDKTQRGEK